MVIFKRSTSRCGVLPGLRKKLAMQAVKEYGKPFSATAGLFDVTATAVSYTLKSQ
jgi:predicted transcriptional regulator